MSKYNIVFGPAPKSEPITVYLMPHSEGLGDVYTMEHFIDLVRSTCIIDDDGCGDLALMKDGILYSSDTGVYCEEWWLEEAAEQFTHVIWYNK